MEFDEEEGVFDDDKMVFDEEEGVFDEEEGVFDAFFLSNLSQTSKILENVPAPE